MGQPASSRQSPALTEVTWKRPLITVTEFNVDLQGGKRRACHVTQRTFYVIHCKTKHHCDDALIKYKLSILS